MLPQCLFRTHPDVSSSSSIPPSSIALFLLRIRMLIFPFYILLISIASASFNIGPNANPITEPATFPTLLPRQGNKNGYTSCESMNEIFNRCQTAMSDDGSLLFNSLAKCYCYSNSSWAPSAYDNAFSSCMGYMKTVSPSFYSASLVPNAWQTAPCSGWSAIAGIAILSIPGLLNFEAGLTATSASITAANSTTDPNRQACSSWSKKISSCSIDHRSAFQTVSGGFQHPVKEASCLCYTTGSGSFVSYAPSGYDNHWSSCLNWYKTADPKLYFNTILAVTSQSVLAHPCAQLGDFIAYDASARPTMTGTATRAGIAPTVPPLTNPVVTIATTAVAPNVANSAAVGHVLGLSSLVLAIALQQL